MFKVYKKSSKMASTSPSSNKYFKQIKQKDEADLLQTDTIPDKKPAVVNVKTLNGIMSANIYLLCPDCIAESRETEVQFTENGDKAIIELIMCQDCVRLNTHIKLRQREHFFKNKNE